MAELVSPPAFLNPYHQGCLIQYHKQQQEKQLSRSHALGTGSPVPQTVKSTLLCCPGEVQGCSLCQVSHLPQVVRGGSLPCPHHRMTDKWRDQLSHSHALGAGSPATSATKASSASWRDVAAALLSATACERQRSALHNPQTPAWPQKVIQTRDFCLAFGGTKSLCCRPKHGPQQQHGSGPHNGFR